MRINPKVLANMDMTGVIQIHDCPSPFKTIAENIVNLLAQPGYSVGEYHTMTELDKTLMWNYWRAFDGLYSNKKDDIYDIYMIREWFIHKATAPELIRRARQWLSERNYVIIDPDVATRAMEAGNKFSKSVKQT